MIAYLFKTRAGWELTICLRPCYGSEFANAPKVAVADKKAARVYCRAHGIKPYNF